MERWPSPESGKTEDVIVLKSFQEVFNYLIFMHTETIQIGGRGKETRVTSIHCLVKSWGHLKHQRHTSSRCRTPHGTGRGGRPKTPQFRAVTSLSSGERPPHRTCTDPGHSENQNGCCSPVTLVSPCHSPTHVVNLLMTGPTRLRKKGHQVRNGSLTGLTSHSKSELKLLFI
jgi:hypothetical protein